MAAMSNNPYNIAKNVENELSELKCLIITQIPFIILQPAKGISKIGPVGDEIKPF